LMSLGTVESVALPATQLSVLYFTVWMFWQQKPGRQAETLPHKSLILLTCIIWLSKTWLSYYSVIGVFLLPSLIHRSRRLAGFLLLLFALSFALPEFTRRYPGPLAILSLVKILPHISLPLVALSLELRDAYAEEDGLDLKQDPLYRLLYSYGKHFALAVVTSSILILCVEVYRHHLAESYMTIGRNFRHQAQPDASEAAFRRLVKLRPHNAQAHLFLAEVLEEQRNIHEAARHYECAVNLDPGLVAARMNLGILKIASGNAEKGIGHLAECVRLVPHDETARFNLALALRTAGRASEAETHLRTAILIKPDFDEARSCLNRLSKATNGTVPPRACPPGAEQPVRAGKNMGSVY